MTGLRQALEAAETRNKELVAELSDLKVQTTKSEASRQAEVQFLTFLFQALLFGCFHKKKILQSIFGPCVQFMRSDCQHIPIFTNNCLVIQFRDIYLHYVFSFFYVTHPPRTLP